jgi:chromosome segregation ATPase
VDELKRATELEHEILRVEDRYHELLAKIASGALSFAQAMEQIALLRLEQRELRIRIDEARADFDPIYRSAFDNRIATLGGLEGVAHRMTTRRARAISPDPT